MKIIFCGDVVGTAGRKAITTHLPLLKTKLSVDFALVNVDNAIGFGTNRKACDEMLQAGADALTGGDHVWDQREVASFIDNYPALLRSENMPEGTPGKGHYLYHTTISQKKVLVIHLQALVFMKYQLDCPFKAVDKVLKSYRLGQNVDCIIVDVHGEATSEKNALGHYLDGRVSLVVGSHTHVPTADHRILPNGTAYQTDAGMCGCYDSVIGMEKDVPINGFVKKRKMGEKMQPASGEASLCGLFVELGTNGLAKAVMPIRVGGFLENSIGFL